MTDEQLWQLRGLLTQVQQIQNDLIAIGLDRKLTDGRKRDLFVRLVSLNEQIKEL
jgi:hypothetical protein